MFCQEFNNNLKDRTNFINETFIKLMKEQEGEKKDKGNEHNNSDDDSNADEKDVIKDDQETPGHKVTLLSLNVCFLALLLSSAQCDCFFGSQSGSVCQEMTHGLSLFCLFALLFHAFME